MKRIGRVVSIALTVAVLIALISGCGNKMRNAASDELVYCVIGEERKDSMPVMEKVNAVLKEKTGVTIKLKYLSTDNYDLVISSGENYDLIAAPDYMGFWTNAAKGAFAELSDEDIKTYAPYIWENGQKYLFATKSGGKRYGIPGFHEYAPDRCYVARGDLMDKYGIEALNNIDDVEKYLFAVADGESEIIPFDMEGFSPYFLLNMWASDWGWAAVGSLSFGEHVYFDINDPERKLFCAIDRPEMKEFTERIKKWNDKGVFSKSVLSNKIFSQS